MVQLPKRFGKWHEITQAYQESTLSCPIVEVVKPVFDRLGDADFLAGCEKCLTQNPNESLHHVIWGLAPKEQYTSPRETSLAVGLGCLLFNSGIPR